MGESQIMSEVVDRIERAKITEIPLREKVAPFAFSAWKGQVNLAGLPETLEFRGEFGTELACFLPFVYWLFRVGAMKGRRICTYHGMRCFYYFLSDEEYSERKETRRHYQQYDKKYQFPNVDEHLAFLRPLECLPNYRQIFQNNIFALHKPNLVIHNKFNDEWGQGPVNYFRLETLRQMFAKASERFQIVYIRPGMAEVPSSYSVDHNTHFPFDDASLLQEFPEVLAFERLASKFNGGNSYNFLKNLLYAATHHFISVQGGASYQCALFSGSMILISHQAGLETRFAYGQGIFRYFSNPSPVLLIGKSDDELVAGFDALVSSCVVGDRILCDVSKAPIIQKLSPKSDEFPSEWAIERYSSLRFSRNL